MKKKILLLMGVFSLGLLQAQVGININTIPANTLLYVKGDASTSGTADVVSISSAGDMAIGASAASITNPAKLNIVKGTAPSAIRLEGYGIATNKVMASDINGNAHFVDMPKMDGRIYNIIPGTRVEYLNNNTYLVWAAPVLKSGTVLAILRWWGDFHNNNLTVNGYTAAQFYLCSSNVAGANFAGDPVLDTALVPIITDPGAITGWAGHNRFSFTQFFSANYSTGQYTKLYIKVTVGAAWAIGAVNADVAFNPSISFLNI